MKRTADLKRHDWTHALTGLCLLGLGAVYGCHDGEAAAPDAAGAAGEDSGGSSHTPGGDAGAPSTGGGASGHAGSAQGGGGEGGEHGEEMALARLQNAVEAQLGGASVVTDVDELAGTTFDLSSYLGPGVDWDGWPGPERLDPQQPDPTLRARATFHVVADGDGLALVSELPGEVFTYPERLSMKRVGDRWLVERLTTSVHTAWTSDEYWTTADYRSALAVLAFADDAGEGSATRVVVAATNGYEGETERDDTANVTVLGSTRGLATAEGPRAQTRLAVAQDASHRIRAGDSMSLPDLDGTIDDVLFGDRAFFAIEPPVAIDSTFHLENAEGETAEVSRIVRNGFVYGVLPRDYLPQGFTLVGSGHDIDGEPFELSQPVVVFAQGRASGNFEDETEWTDFCIGGETAVLTSYEGTPAIAGTRSLHAQGCPRLRIARDAGATMLKLSAAAFGHGTYPSRLDVQIRSMAPQGTTVTARHEFANDDVQALTFDLPPEAGDVLVTLYGGDLWLDSLRTE